MITTLTGSNSFGLQRKLKSLVGDFIKEHSDMALERLDGEEVEFDRIRESLQSLPFLASKKLVVLRTPGANKEFIEKAEKLLSEVPETTDVILVEPKLDKRSSYYKFLSKKTDFQQFNELDEVGLSNWLVDEAKKARGTLGSADARYLINRVGPDQQMLWQELQKLVVYDPKISRETIDLLVEPTPSSSIFDLLDSALSGNTKQMLKLYTEQRAQKVEPQQIIAMLAWQLHVLAVIKTAGDRNDNQIASDAKLNPYVVRKSRSISANITGEKLKNLVRDLTKLDEDLKSISIDADDAVKHYLLTLTT